MRRDILTCGAALLMAGGSAFAQLPSARTVGAAPVLRPRMDARIGPIVFTSRALIEQDYHHGLNRLRKTALKQMAADGGVLSPESVDRLQARLDKLNMVRRRDLRLLQRS